MTNDAASSPLNPVGCRCDCHVFLQSKFSRPVGIACKLCASDHWCSLCERNLDTQGHEEECPEGLRPLTEADLRTMHVSWQCPECGWRRVQAVACMQCHAWCEPSSAAASSPAPASPVQPNDNESCSHWREGDSDHCVWCGDDLGPTTEADVATPLQPTGEQEKCSKPKELS